MITTYTDKKSLTFYKVRVFARSNIHPLIRITKQQGGIGSLRDAQKVEEQLKKESQREISSLEAKGILFEDLLNSWNEHSTKMKVLTGIRGQITQLDYLAGVKKWFKTFLRQPATDLNAYKVAEVFEEMKVSGITFAHRKKMKQVLKSIFDFGIQSGMINFPRSPTIEVILKRDAEKKPEILNAREIQLLIDRAYSTDHTWKRIWAVALLTGMRSGELYALEWKDIDWDNKTINVNKSFNCRLKEFKSTKAGYWRHVPIAEDLRLVLKDQFQSTSRETHVFPRSSDWTRGSQAKILRSFCYLCGLPNIKFHTLRACFATQMLGQGVEPAKVMKVCGWKELKTMQYYVRLAGIEIAGSTEGLRIFSSMTSAQKQMLGGEKSPPAFFMSNFSTENLQSTHNVPT